MQMKFREYVDIANVILRPKRASKQLEAANAQLAKLRAYVKFLEKNAGFDPNSKRVALTGVDNGEALVILGDEAYVKDCIFHAGQTVVIHPDAKYILISGCHFMGHNLKETGVDL